MREIFQPLLFLLARSIEEDLQRQNEFLKAENEMLRCRVPKQRIFLKQHEREKLLKLGMALGPGIRHVITIVAYSTFRRWVRKAKGEEKEVRWDGHESLLTFVSWLSELLVKRAGDTAASWAS